MQRLEKKEILFPRGIKYWSRFENKQVDLVNDLLLELTAFPFGEHDDMSDCLSRACDLFLNTPRPKAEVVTEAQTHTAGYRFEQLLKQRRQDKWQKF